MKKLWSFFWLVVASAIAFTIISQMVSPYIPVIAALFVIGVVLTISYKVYKYRRSGRRNF
ncbi:hypothetical protein [Leucobacter sp. G161]|uniref:hypothetical protein n=1 Tax=Leucobacter sp. G161 TaxID=663704 RepID=UPI00073BE40D|nr:hypothetical protein [Leucobacter sp. G161]KUF08440.1 hypothetical protein AUL38_04610 [Leucobacter sp. G161]